MVPGQHVPWDAGSPGHDTPTGYSKELSAMAEEGQTKRHGTKQKRLESLKNETIRQKLERQAGSASEVTNSKSLLQCLL